MEYSPECPRDNLQVEKPKWEQLTPGQQAMFGNGVGPDWIGSIGRKILTGYSSWFFDEASWKHHDFGYSVGHEEIHRKASDRKFLAAMRFDAKKHKGLKKQLALRTAMTFFFFVRRGGTASFFYCNRFRTITEIAGLISLYESEGMRIMPDGLTRGW